MPFARNQLAGSRDRQYAVIDAELLPELAVVRLYSERIAIDRAANDSNPTFLNVMLTKNRSDRFGYRNNFSKRPVAQRGHQSHLGIVNATGDDGWYVGIRGSQTTEQISPATAMAMDNVRLLIFEILRQPIGKRQIKIAGAKQILNPNPCQSSDAVDPGIGRANQRIVMTPLA